MDGFTFYKSFYDTIKMRKPQDRIKTAFAILEYVFDDKEPEELSEIAEIAFELLRHTLQKSKTTEEAQETKSNDNQNSETISNDFKTILKKVNRMIIKRNRFKTSSSLSLSLSSKAD
ncbi:MAG: DUF6291 domain-containing protein [Christensenellaceae bacterium]